MGPFRVSRDAWIKLSQAVRAAQLSPRFCDQNTVVLPFFERTPVKRTRTAIAFAAAAACAAAVVAQPVQAQGAGAFPVRAVRTIVAFPVGSSPDLVARAVGEEVTKMWGQPVIVENRAGAGAIIGTDTVAKAAPDGYTIYMATLGALALNPHLYKKLPYDPVRDFAGITYVAENPFAVAVHPSLPVKSVSELIAHAKANPGKLNYGSGASFAQLVGEAFKIRTGTQITHVPYKGVQPAITEFLAGQVQLIFADLPSVLPFHKSGKARILGVTGGRRSSVAPDIPTIAEAGVPEYDYATWYAYVAPAATPRPVIERLNADLSRALNLPDVRRRLGNLGLEVRPSSPDAVNQLIKSEITKWATVVKAAGIEAQ